MSVTNEQIAELLESAGKLLEIEDAGVFRIRAHVNAADTIRTMGKPLAERVAEGEDLTQLPDIGKGIAKKIEEIVAHGFDKSLAELAAGHPPGLLDLLKIPGLGPKRVRALRETLNVTSLESLLQAATDDRLKEVPGFGAKTQERVVRRARRLLGLPE